MVVLVARPLPAIDENQPTLPGSASQAIKGRPRDAQRPSTDNVLSGFTSEKLKGQALIALVEHTLSDITLSKSQKISVWLGAFPDLHLAADKVVVKGDRVALKATWQGTHRGVFFGLAPSGRVVNFSATVYLEVRGGEVVRRWGDVDTQSLMSQLGASNRSRRSRQKSMPLLSAMQYAGL